MRNRPCLFLTRGYLSILAILLAAGCGRELGRVGKIPIREKDVVYRAKVSDIYLPGSGKNYVGLAQLIKGYLSAELLLAQGVAVDEAALEKEADRIEKNTKTPEVLERIKAIYGKDREAYRDTFVRVVYSERVLYNEVFLKSREIQQDRLRIAEDLLEKSREAQRSFRDIAKYQGIESDSLIISLKFGIVREGRKDTTADMRNGSGIEQAKRLVEIASRVRSGEMFPGVVEWRDGYQVLRLVRKERNGYFVESASIKKRSYDNWFWEKASRIPITIRDPALREELLKEVPWASKLWLR